MVRVAIAGGTGGLGRTVVSAILSAEAHEVFILSRSPATTSASQSPAPTHLTLDYTSPASIAALLTEHSIDTIISVLRINTPEDAESQLNLIRGASLSGVVTRFAPSEFGINYLEAEKSSFHFPASSLKTAAIRALQETSLQYTRFVIGTFMDYLLPPSPSSPTTAVPTNLLVIALFLDHANAQAVIPGDGEKTVVFTHSTDVARFVAKSLDLESWPAVSFVVGSRNTLNEIVTIAEEVKGTEFSTHHISLSALEAKHIPELDYNVQRYAHVPKQMVDGIFTAWGTAVTGGWLDIGPSVSGGEGTLSVSEFLHRG